MTTSMAKYINSVWILEIVECAFVLGIRSLCSNNQIRIIFNWNMVKDPWVKFELSREKNVSFKHVKNWMAWSSSLHFWATCRATHMHLWMQVQIGKVWWKLSSSRKLFNSINYSMTCLEFCLGFLMEEWRVTVRSRPTFENLS